MLVVLLFLCLAIVSRGADEKFDKSGLLVDDAFAAPKPEVQIRSGYAIVTGAAGSIGEAIAAGAATGRRPGRRAGPDARG